MNWIHCYLWRRNSQKSPTSTLIPWFPSNESHIQNFCLALTSHTNGSTLTWIRNIIVWDFTKITIFLSNICTSRYATLCMSRWHFLNYWMLVNCIWDLYLANLWLYINNTNIQNCRINLLNLQGHVNPITLLCGFLSLRLIFENLRVSMSPCKFIDGSFDEWQCVCTCT